MTSKQFQSWMINQLRRISYRWEGRYLAERDARVILDPLPLKNGRAGKKKRVRYQCAMCKELFSAKQKQMHHINPVINPKTGFKDWNTIIKRMFVDKKGWMCLCKSCHRVETNKENKER